MDPKLISVTSKTLLFPQYAVVLREHCQLVETVPGSIPLFSSGKYGQHHEQYDNMLQVSANAYHSTE